MDFAIVLHGTGMLAKFSAEAIDDVAQPVTALESAGATVLQRLRYAIWPQMAPAVLRNTIFRFELNLRGSLVLGVVGAGGNRLLHSDIRSFRYEKAATVTPRGDRRRHSHRSRKRSAPATCAVTTTFCRSSEGLLTEATVITWCSQQSLSQGEGFKASTPNSYSPAAVPLYEGGDD